MQEMYGKHVSGLCQHREAQKPRVLKILLAFKKALIIGFDHHFPLLGKYLSDAYINVLFLDFVGFYALNI